MWATYEYTVVQKFLAELQEKIEKLKIDNDSTKTKVFKEIRSFGDFQYRTKNTKYFIHDLDESHDTILESVNDTIATSEIYTLTNFILYVS